MLPYNKVGREIGEANSKATHKEISDLVGKALSEGKLITNLDNVPSVEP